jgi:threonine/homoserine/homoserine lactone efflux protein
MVGGWLDVAMGLCWLWFGAYLPKMRTRNGRKPLHAAVRWIYLVLGVVFIVYGLVRAF